MCNAKTMTNSERGVKASQERWHPTIPKATHSAIINIGGQEIECDVLQDGRRVLRQKTFLKAMGRGEIGGSQRERQSNENLPVFIKANNLSPYLKQDFIQRASPIKFKSKDGKRLIGYEAIILPEACKIYVQAECDGVLQENQIKIAKVCKIMICGLASVGIIALIDEKTGYQEVRARNELELILEKYISQELRQWTKRFPDEFFKQTYRLHGWDYPKINKNHPQYVGKIINKYIYEKLPEGVLDELKNKNPSDENGNRKFRLHQFLTDNIGDDNLQKQIFQVITLMKVSNNIEDFKNLVEKL